MIHSLDSQIMHSPFFIANCLIHVSFPFHHLCPISYVFKPELLQYQLNIPEISGSKQCGVDSLLFVETLCSIQSICTNNLTNESKKK